MKVACINGSPKHNHSASELLLQDLQTCFTSDVVFKTFHIMKPTLENAMFLELCTYDVWVFAFPLYVDGIPSHLLACLCQMEEQGIEHHNIRIYGIVNCGFYEGKQNALAIEILRNWCYKVELPWGMGIGLGGGGGLAQMSTTPLGKGPKKSLGKAFAILQKHIEQSITGEDIYISIDFPRWLYKFLAEMGWKLSIREHGGNLKDLHKRY